MAEGASIVWFRQDLRLADNPALRAAIDRGAPTICLYVLDDAGEGEWAAGGASRWWLHHSLGVLGEELAKLGQTLVFREGRSDEVLTELVGRHGVDAVFWNRRYEPTTIRRDTAIKSSLKERGVDVQSFRAGVLFEPNSYATQSGDPYKVFTPFWNQIVKRDDPAPPLPRPRKLPTPVEGVASSELADLALLPTISWDEGFYEEWTPGELGARDALRKFGDECVGAYAADRDYPAVEGTSRLSPHLHFGEVSPTQVWHEIRDRQRELRGKASESATGFLRQIVWREFAHQLLYYYPETPEKPLREAFAQFPWRKDAKALAAWKKGRTGYPIVDAGMRELWHTGWMHNRVRMIVGSFLVKHLLLHWHHGAAWFWDTLVDADLANNTLGWQWISGCGADAAPYFRVFNPILQGAKFDPDGEYVRKWVPELAGLPNDVLHEPWNASADVLEEAGVVLGTTYPKPIVDHKVGRTRALDAYAKLKAKAESFEIPDPVCAPSN
ncbi:MAG: deoxyribodipyrimidine photo-lyase [Candidatus Eisenbacteria bacterium]